MNPVPIRQIAKLLGLSRNQVIGLIRKHKLSPVLDSTRAESQDSSRNSSQALYLPSQFFSLRPLDPRRLSMNQELADAYLSYLNNAIKN